MVECQVLAHLELILGQSDLLHSEGLEKEGASRYRDLARWSVRTHVHVGRMEVGRETTPGADWTGGRSRPWRCVMDEREHVIVCGIDGSDGGQRALEWAIDEATRRGCTLRVVTAWSWDGVEAFGAASSPAEERLRAQKAQDAAMTRALAEAETAPEVERLLLRGTPSEALTTASQNAELLVLGSHGHGMTYDALVGSTSQRAIHHALCPVVILPNPHHTETPHRGSGAELRSGVPKASPQL